jgi:hypothetical protein
MGGKMGGGRAITGNTFWIPSVDVWCAKETESKMDGGVGRDKVLRGGGSIIHGRVVVEREPDKNNIQLFHAKGPQKNNKGLTK